LSKGICKGILNKNEALAIKDGFDVLMENIVTIPGRLQSENVFRSRPLPTPKRRDS
jgi:hypothetical protein